jgi:MFS family permease
MTEGSSTAAEGAGPGWAAALGSFTVPSFRWVWAAALSGNSGRFAVILVAGWEAYRLGGHSALWPSLVSFFLLVPTMVFGLVAGSYADRLNRALLAAAGLTVNATACAVAAACIAARVMDLAGIIVVSAVVGLGNSIQGPAWQALVPSLVGPERIVNAALAVRVAQQGSELIGPAIGTVVLTTTGPGGTFLLCAVLYAGGVAMMAHLRHAAARASTGPRAPVRAQVAEGIGYIKRTSPLGFLFTWVTCHCSLTMATFGILPTIASVNFHGAAGAYGLLLTTFGLGSILGPVTLMSLPRQYGPGRVLLVTGVLSGLPLVLLGLTHVEWLALVMSMLAGMGQALFMATIYSSVMRCSADEKRGRVASVQLSITTGAMGLASLGWGALVSVIAAGLVLAVPGAVFAAVCLGISRQVPMVNALVEGGGRTGEPAVTTTGSSAHRREREV